MEVSTNNELLISQPIYVENAITSLILKTIPVIFEVEPFSENNYISNDKFTVENRGNVPLKLSVSYGKYENIFSTLNLTEIHKPGEKKRYSILLQSRSTWNPGIKQIKAGEVMVKGELQNIISPKSIVYLISSNVSIGLPINIYVGRSGFIVEPLVGDIAFQHIDTIDIYYNEIKDIFSYISGNGSVIVNVSGKNLDIIKILSRGTEVTPPFKVESVYSSEHPIVVRVKGIMPESIALLHYTLEIDGEIEKFSTQINVGSFRIEDEPTFEITIIIGLIIFIVIGYLLYNIIKQRKK